MKVPAERSARVSELVRRSVRSEADPLVRRWAGPGPAVDRSTLLALQRRAGNVAVTRLVAQRQPGPSSNQNYTGEEAIQERLAELEEDKDEIGADVVGAQQKDPSQAQTLQAELTVVEREILMLEGLHEAGMNSTEQDGPPWNRSEREVARLIDKARTAARTEKATLSFLQVEDLRADRISVGAVTPTLLQQPDLFRTTTLALYQRVTAEMVKRRNEHEAKYKDAMAALASRPVTEVIADYVRMRKNWFQLEGQIRRVHWDVQLQPFAPLQLRQRRLGSPDVVVDQLDVLVGTQNVDRTVPGVTGQLGNLKGPLADWHLTASYGEIAGTMQRFSAASQADAPPGQPIAAYQGSLPADLGWAAGNEAGSTSGFLFDVGRVLRQRLDAILLATAGLDLLKGIFIFGSYFDAASDADTFEKLYAAVEGLQGAEQSVVDLMVSLAANAGALKGYGKYRKGTKLDSLEALAKEPVVRDVPSVRKAVDDAKQARKEAKELKKTAPGKPRPREGEAGLHLEDLLGEEVQVLDNATKARLGKEGDFIHPRSGRTYDAVTAIGSRLNTPKEWAEFTTAVERATCIARPQSTGPSSTSSASTRRRSSRPRKWSPSCSRRTGRRGRPWSGSPNNDQDQRRGRLAGRAVGHRARAARALGGDRRRRSAVLLANVSIGRPRPPEPGPSRLQKPPAGLRRSTEPRVPGRTGSLPARRGLPGGGVRPEPARLLLSLDPRAGDAAGPEAAARDFVLVNAAAAFREERPSVAVLVLEAMPSKRGAAGLDRLRPAEREELVRVLRSLRQTRFAAAAGDDQALWSRITAATDRAIRDLRQAKDREGGDPGSEPW